MADQWKVVADEPYAEPAAPEWKVAADEPDTSLAPADEHPISRTQRVMDSVANAVESGKTWLMGSTPEQEAKGQYSPGVIPSIKTAIDDTFPTSLETGGKIAGESEKVAGGLERRLAHIPEDTRQEQADSFRRTAQNLAKGQGLRAGDTPEQTQKRIDLLNSYADKLELKNLSANRDASSLTSQMKQQGDELIVKGLDTLDQTQPRDPGFVKRSLLSAAGTVPHLAAAIGAGAVGGPGASLASLAATQYGSSYADAVKHPGFTEDDRQNFAAASAGLATVFNAAPVGVAMKPAADAMKQFFLAWGVSIPTQEANLVSQQLLAEHAGMSQPLTSEQWAQGAIDTAVGMGLFTGAHAMLGGMKGRGKFNPEEHFSPENQQAMRDEMFSSPEVKPEVQPLPQLGMTEHDASMQRTPVPPTDLEGGSAGVVQPGQELSAAPAQLSAPGPTGRFEVGPDGAREYTQNEVNAQDEALAERQSLGTDNITRMPAVEGAATQEEPVALKGAAAKRAIRQQKVETLHDAITDIVQPSEVTVKNDEQGWSIYVRHKPIVSFETEGLARQELNAVRQEIANQKDAHPVVMGEKIEVPAEPTQAQATAGNYKKPPIKWNGLDIKVENVKDSTRSGVDANGEPWSRRMASDYGYFKGTKSNDGEGVDVYMGPHRAVKTAYVVDQLKAGGLSHDEPKVVIGVRSEEEAKKLYLRHYPKEWKGLGAITPMPVDALKSWLNSDRTTEPLSWQAKVKTPEIQRSTQIPQAKHDSVLEYLSKLKLHGAESRGLDISALEHEGLDPAEMKSAAGHGINRPFTRGGGSLDHAAEVLTEAGFPVHGDKNKLLDLITAELRGGKKTFAGERNLEHLQEQFRSEHDHPHEMTAEEEAAIEARLERQAIQHEHDHEDDAPLFARGEDKQNTALVERMSGSKVVDKDGKPLRVYHGTGRGDRFVKGIKAGRATSGPMPYFTDSHQVASGYATGKRDTSMSGDEMHYREWFRYQPNGARADQPITRMWHELSAEQKSKFNEALTRLQQHDDTGKIVDNGENGGISPDTYRYELKQAHGNGIEAATELWLTSGALFNQEHHFMEVLKQAGIDTKKVDFVPQHSDAFPTVVPTYLSIKNPLDTGSLPNDLVEKLEQAVKGTRGVTRQGADPWDKISRFTPKEWVAQLKTEIAAGKEQHVWTSIPDKITEALVKMGYDGIKDVGGKNGGQSHTVWIPFRRDQVISATGKKDVLFKRGQEKGALSKEAIQSEVDRFLNNLKTKPEVEIVPSYKELPADLKDSVTEDWSISDVSAVYWKGKVYIVQDKQTSPEGVRESIIHETAHFAVAKLFDQAARHQLLDELVKVNRMETVRRGVQAFGKTVRDTNGKVTAGFDPGNPMQRRVAANESMAYYAQKYLNNESIPARIKRVVERWIAAIRDAIRKFFGASKVLDELHLKKVISDMIDRLKRGDEGMQAASDNAMAARTPVQVDSKEFKRWFGQSKVVDESERPLVVFHGTDKTFDTFDKTRIGNDLEGGFWFHENPDYTADYGDNNMAVYLKMEKPYHVSYNDWMHERAPSIEELKAKGFDGVKIDDFDAGNEEDSDSSSGTAYLVFEPTQIKSATDNSGKFDPKNPSILAHQTAPTFYSALTRTVEDMKANKASPEQWIASIKNAKGVKSDEIEWSGVNEWLKSQTEPVSKEQLAEYLRANEIQVQDVLKGGKSENLAQQEQDRLVVELTALGYTPNDGAYGDFSLDSNDGKEHWLLGNDGWFNSDGKSRTEHLPEMVEALASDLSELRKDMAEGRDSTVREDDETRYGHYTLPGGKNYRELLLTLPAKQFDDPLVSGLQDLLRRADKEMVNSKYESLAWNDANGRARALRKQLVDLTGDPYGVPRKKSGAKGRADEYRSSHWSEPNILAHVRFDERTDADGKRVLHIAEVQSDWHQQGRKRGYKPTVTPARAAEISSRILEIQKQLKPATKDSWEHAALHTEELILSEELNGSPSKIPDAPFKTTWPELAMKRMIRYAAENGFDRITWDTGATNADRYNLRNVVEHVTYNPPGSKRAEKFGAVLSAYDKNGDRIFGKDVQPDKVADYIGKDASQKLLNTPIDRYGQHSLSGIELEVGGEGMVAFYDRIIPATVSKYAKKWGAKVGDGSVARQERVGSPHEYTSYSDVHSLDITPAMRSAAMEGQPLFKRKNTLPTAKRRNPYEAVSDFVKNRVNGDLARSIRKMFAPTGLSAESKQTARVARAELGSLAAETRRTQEQLDQFSKLLDTISTADKIEFIDAMEHGGRQPIAELQPVADALRKMLDVWKEKVQGLGNGDLDNFIENYFPHVWKDYNKAKSAFGRRPLRGPATFKKQRTIPTTKEGLDQGLTPLSYNPLVLTLVKVREMQRYVSGTLMMRKFKEAGLAQFFPSGKPLPDGWVEINDAVGRVRQWSEEEKGFIERGRYAMPEDAARVINNHLSASLLKDFPPAEMLRVASNALNAMQLGFSGFHLGFTTLDAVISKNALGIERVLHGEPLKAIAAFAEAATPAGAVMNVRRGQKLLNAYLNPSGATPQMQALVKALEAAGGRVSMDQYYLAAQGVSPFKGVGVSSFASDIRKTFKLPFDQIPHELGKHAANFAVAYPTRIARDMLEMSKLFPVWQIPFEVAGRVTRASTAFIMEHIVPLQKLGVFSDLAQDALRRDPSMSEEKLQTTMQRIWNSVDNRLGEMVYDNLFWNRTQKDAMHLGVRAVGWNYGTVSEIGGAPIDTMRLLDQLAREGKISADDVGHKIPYVIAMTITTMMLGAMLTYLLTGKGPQEIKDYFFPPTGGKTKYGTPQRISLPSYAKDVYEYSQDPSQTVINKANPIFSIIHEVWANEDYFGNAIYNPDASTLSKAGEIGQHLLEASRPFSFQSGKQIAGADQPGGFVRKVMPFVGFGVAPGYVSSTNEIERRRHLAEMQKYDNGLRRREKTARDTGDVEAMQKAREERQQLRQTLRKETREIRHENRINNARQRTGNNETDTETETTSKLDDRIAPLMEGKTKAEFVRSLKDAGHPALAALFADMPAKPRPQVAKALHDFGSVA